MPPLTKLNKKKEADFGVYLKKWMEKNPWKTSCSLELKQTESDSISFNCLEPKQIAYGLKIKGEGAWIRVVGLDGQPDYVWMTKSYSYIVIRFPKHFCFIDIDDFLKEKKSSSRKSLTSKRAREISIYDQAI